jgi:acetyl esterase/lipase
LPAQRLIAKTEPSKADLSYGESRSQTLDIYLPEGKGPFPFLLQIHGGGWHSGDKKWQSDADIARIKDAGCALVTINYRLLGECRKAGVFPPLAGVLEDCRRALQFVRFHATEWNLDPARVAVYGESAGAFNALWLALSPEMADPASPDPIARESTRILAVGGRGAQTSLDPIQMREWAGEKLNYGAHAFGLGEKDHDLFLTRRNEWMEHIRKLSPAELVSSDDPPIYLDYGNKSPDQENKDSNYFVHSPGFGLGFQELAREKGATCYLSYKDHPAETDPPSSALDFLIFSVKH